MSEEFNIAVVIINQCMADPGAMSMFGPVSYKEINLKFLLHLLTTISRFGLNRSSNQLVSAVEILANDQNLDPAK